MSPSHGGLREELSPSHGGGSYLEEGVVVVVVGEVGGRTLAPTVTEEDKKYMT